MTKLFVSYAHADEAYRIALDKHLAPLRRQGVIETWQDRMIDPGAHVDESTDAHLDTADIVLLLLSADFINSEYCYANEVQHAMARHDAGEATVIPVLLRPCLWDGFPFSRVNASPKDARPVSEWGNADAAYVDIARAVRIAGERRQQASARRPASASIPTDSITVPPMRPAARHGNVTLPRTFTQRYRDDFEIAAFEAIAEYMASSLQALEAANTGIESRFERIDRTRLQITV